MVAEAEAEAESESEGEGEGESEAEPDTEPERPRRMGRPRGDVDDAMAGMSPARSAASSWSPVDRDDALSATNSWRESDNRIGSRALALPSRSLLSLPLAPSPPSKPPLPPPLTSQSTTLLRVAANRSAAVTANRFPPPTERMASFHRIPPSSSTSTAPGSENVSSSSTGAEANISSPVRSTSRCALVMETRRFLIRSMSAGWEPPLLVPSCRPLSDRRGSPSPPLPAPPGLPGPPSAPEMTSVDESPDVKERTESWNIKESESMREKERRKCGVVPLSMEEEEDQREDEPAPNLRASGGTREPGLRGGRRAVESGEWKEDDVVSDDVPDERWGSGREERPRTCVRMALSDDSLVPSSSRPCSARKRQMMLPTAASWRATSGMRSSRRALFFSASESGREAVVEDGEIGCLILIESGECGECVRGVGLGETVTE